MSDLICRKTMTRCQTPGMCAPHGGCSTSAEAARAALAERAVAPAPASGVPGAIGVKRYIPDGYTQPASRSGTGTHMVESRDGDYVLASDYDAMQAERDGANERAGLLLKAKDEWAARARAAEAERDRLRAVLDGAQYPNIDRLKSLTEEQCRQVGEAVMRLTIAAQSERDQLRAAISDPESVYVNMKRGTIAKPGLRSMIDLYGEVPNGDETQLLEIAQLRAEVEQLRKDAERYRGVRRGAAAHGYTEEQFDEQTDRQLARLNDAMRAEQ